MRHFFVVLACAVAALAAVSAAGARPPEITVIPVDGSVPPLEFTDLCPGVTLTQSFTGTIRIIRQFDRTGTAVREIQVFPTFTVTYTGNGKSLSTAGPAPLFLTLNDDGTVAESKVVGLLGVFHVPGGAPLIIDAGYLLFEGEFPLDPIVVLHGRHDFFGPEADLTAFCEYFTG
jgi:hypothetical protein